MSNAAHMFLGQMLWRPVDAPDIPEPVVALLGPRGSGKTTALRTLAGECGKTVVHAKVDFAALDPVAAVAYVAFELMSGWRNLSRDPTFHRVGLTLLALNERLPDNRLAARTRVKHLIREYVRGTKAGQLAQQITDTMDASIRFATALTGIGSTPQGQLVQAVNQQAKPIIGAVLQRAAWWDMRSALHWLRGLPNSAADRTIDSLIELSRHRANVLNHLMAALLADIEDNVTHTSRVAATCHCMLPWNRADRRHDHAWVLLVDNADNDNGRRFLTALIHARQQRANVTADQRPERDPLLVVVAVDRWRSQWSQWWREPWRPADVPGRDRIPLFSQANREQWIQHIATTGRPAEVEQSWYPVWLDPLTADEIPALAGQAPTGWDEHTFSALVTRLSGGRPSAVLAITERIASQLTEQPPDDYPTLTLDDRVRALLYEGGTPLWEQALRECLPKELLGSPLWQTIPDMVTVLALLDHANQETGVPHILSLLRRHLWVSTFEAHPSRLWPVAQGDVEPAAAIHPWLARCLLACLWAEDPAMARRPGGRGWDNVFAALSSKQDAASARALYCDLARGQFDAVVTALAERFTSDPHQDWIRLVDQVTSAPCPWPAVESTSASMLRLAPDDNADHTKTHTIIATCVALLWLYRDPLTVPNSKWDGLLRSCFSRLSTHDHARLDASALEAAADLFL